VIAFVDTDVLVECLRGTAEADRWLRSTSRTSFHVPGVVAMELLMGCSTKQELRQVQRFLKTLTIVWPNASEFAAAYRLLARHCLTSGMSIPDSLVASMAMSRSARLYTFNVKDFRVVKHLDVAEPYARP